MQLQRCHTMEATIMMFRPLRGVQVATKKNSFTNNNQKGSVPYGDMFSVILHTFIITIILIFVNAFIKNLPTHSKMYRQFILCQNFLKRLYLISTSFSGSISDFLSKVCAIRFFRLSNSLLSTSLGSLIILSITPILNRS